MAEDTEIGPDLFSISHPEVGPSSGGRRPDSNVVTITS